MPRATLSILNRIYAAFSVKAALIGMRKVSRTYSVVSEHETLTLNTL